MNDKSINSIERTFNFSEISMLVDAIYKSNAGLEESYGDNLLEHLEHQNLLTLDRLEEIPAKEVLKLFRGCLNISSAILS